MLDNVALIPEEEYEEMLQDIEYWHLVSCMLSEILTENEIDHEISEEEVGKYIATKSGMLS